MIDLAFAVFLATIGLGAGRRLLDRVGQAPEHPLDAAALSVPLGLGVLALGVLGLGELGWLNRIGVAVLLAVMMELGIVPAVRTLRDLAILWRGRQAPDRRGSVAGWIAAGLLVLALAGTAVVATGPVTDGDALCYHLQVPKVFLMAGAVGFDPDLHETVYPLLTELVYAVALDFRGPVVCRWTQWFLGLALAANVMAMARPNLGRRAWWAGAIVLLAPAISNGMSAPLNDIALAAFGAAAIFAWTRLLDRPTPMAAAVAGVLAGLAVGVKYPALVLVGLMGGFLWLRGLKGLFVVPLDENLRAAPLTPSLSPLGRGRPPGPSATALPSGKGDHHPLLSTREKVPEGRMRGRIRRRGPFSSGQRSWLALAVLYSLATLAVGGWWYLRAYVHTGNPVYPFFRNAFGGAGLDEVLDPIKRPMAVTFWNLLLALGPLTLQPDRFDSFSHQFGPIFLLFLPATLLERPPRRVLGLTALGYLFLVVCLTQRQSMRFVLIALGPLSVAVTYGLGAWCDRKTLPARLMVVVLLGALGLEAGLAMVRGRHLLGVLAGRESSETLLSRREPTYVVGQWAARHLPATARVIGQDHRGFYIPRPYTMELAYRRRTGLGRQGEAAAEIVARLRQSGFTHLMLCPPVPETAVEFDPTLGRLLGPWLAGRAPIYRDDLTDGDGVLRRYAIYRLSDDGQPRPSRERERAVRVPSPAPQLPEGRDTVEGNRAASVSERSARPDGSAPLGEGRRSVLASRPTGGPPR
jgi:hypothetical protein